ncbi:MAG: hypothetical protein ACLFQK_06785 [Fibrobacterota bacterium]
MRFFTLLTTITLFSSTLLFAGEDGFTIGGAMRYNIIATNYESDNKPDNTKFTFDTWRLNVDGEKDGIGLSFEYRFYPTFATHFIHHGYLSYNFGENTQMQLGATQVPFGITPYASHSWWFQIPYYVGLEDDYDMGVKFDLKPMENLEMQIAYFRQSEPEGPYYGGLSTFGNSGPGRYSYDITPDAGNGKSIKEMDQGNIRAAYKVNENIEIGASGQVGAIYNSVLEGTQLSYAGAGHVVAKFGSFDFKGEYIRYNYKAKDDNGDIMKTVPMGAYGSIYPVAAKADIICAGLAYSMPVELGPISNIQPYIDYSLLSKANEDFENTHHLIPGMLVTSGSVYTYIDFALGKNQPWLTDSFGTGLGKGMTYATDVDEDRVNYTDDASKAGEPVPVSDLDWNMRFNINIGYYF